MNRLIVFFALIVLIFSLSWADQPHAPGPPFNWLLVWYEPFNGTTLDTTVWEKSWFQGDGPSVSVTPDELQCYDASQVSVSGGYLWLIADTNTVASCLLRNSNQAPYRSGLINSRRQNDSTGVDFSIPPGDTIYRYVEAKINLHGSSGNLHNWPAFWTNGYCWPETGEIDIMEGLSGHQPCYNYHHGTDPWWPDSCNTNGTGYQIGAGCMDWETPNGWHYFGVLWKPDTLVWYFDGDSVGIHVTGVDSLLPVVETDDRQYLILNLAVPTWTGYTPEIPCTMQVDYVKIFSGPYVHSKGSSTHPHDL